MDSFIRTLKTPTGEALNPCFRLMGSFMLVTLNDDSPLEAVPPAVDARTSPEEWNGMLHDWEWATKPDLDHAIAAHRAYMPRADRQFFNGDHRDWVFAWNAAMETTDVAPYRCLSPESTRIRMASDEAWSWAAHICAKCPGLAPNCPARPELAALTALYPEKAEFNTAVWRMRRAVLELYGFIAGALLNMKDWRRNSWADSLADKVDGSGILTGPKRGVLLDVTELNEDVVRRYIAHGVPVHYRWRFRPPPKGSLAVYAPLAIGAFDFDERRRREQAEFERERKAKKDAGRKKAFQMAESSASGGNKGKKKWFKLIDGEGALIPISAAEGKRLSNDFKVDMSKSTDTGEIAVVHEGVYGDDDDDDVSMYLAPAPALPPTTGVIAPAIPRSLQEAPEEWPALPSQSLGATEVVADEMDIDRDVEVSLGDEDEDLLARDETVAVVKDPDSPTRMEVDEAPERETSTTSARQAQDEDRVAPSARRVTAAVARYEHGTHSPPRPRRDRREQRGRHGRSHSIGGDTRRDSGRERFRPYSPSRHWRARTRSRSHERGDAWRPSDRSGSWPSRPRTPSPPSPDPTSAPASTEQVAGPPTESPAPRSFDINSLSAEDARRVLVDNLSAVSAQQLLQVLLRQTDGESQALLAVLSSPEGIPGSSEPAPGRAPAGSFGGRIRDAAETHSSSASSSHAVVHPLPGRSDGQVSPPPPGLDPLISRLGLPLEQRLATAPSESSLQARMGEANAPAASVLGGTKAACSAWILQMMLRNGNTVTEVSPFSGDPATISRPTSQPSAGVHISWEPRAELRVRRWFMTGAVHTVQDAAELAFRLGCACKAWTHAPPDWHPSAWQKPGFQNLPYLPHTGGDQFFSAPALLLYKANVAAVLSRPHARGALMAGGFLWRIALEWGPRWLVDDLWRVADPQRELVEYDPSTHRITPALSRDEVDALLGVATGQGGRGAVQLFPPLDQVARSVWSVGQWTPKNESWFVNRARLIHTGALNIPAVAKTGWKSTVRVRSHERQSSWAEMGTVAEAEYILRQAREAYPLADDRPEISSFDSQGTFGSAF
ncbi:hypothetical protein C8R47DRAFT_1231040 [Mycena vitilis]|nr:hypothetical protein C8R47DRAFT_1231040 [Mycena vitilis]